MPDSVPLHITSLFLLLIVVTHGGYLWRKFGFHRNWIPIKPHSFLLLAFLAMGASGFFSVAVGVSKGLLGLALGVGTVLSLLHPMVAVSFFIANVLLRPWELAGENPILPIIPKLLASVCLLSWGVVRLKSRNFKIVWTRECTIFSLLMIWLALSAAFSGSMEEGLTYLFDSFFPIAVICFLIVNTTTEMRDLRVLHLTFAISIVGLIAVAVYLTYTSPLFAMGQRLQGLGLLGNANDLAAVAVLIIPFIVIPLLGRGGTALAWVAGLAGTGILVTGLWMSQSRGAIASLGLCVVVYFLLCTRSVGGRSLVRTAIMGGLAIAVPVLLFFSINRDKDELEGSSDSRWNYAVTGFRMARTHPFFGVGIGKYPENYERYTALFIETGKRTAHSSWVLVLAEAGFMGLFLFVSLVWGAFASAWRIRFFRPEFFVGLMSYTIAMSFLSHTYILIPYLLMALVLVAARVIPEEPQ